MHIFIIYNYCDINEMLLYTSIEGVKKVNPAVRLMEGLDVVLEILMFLGGVGK